MIDRAPLVQALRDIGEQVDKGKHMPMLGASIASDPLAGHYAAELGHVVQAAIVGNMAPVDVIMHLATCLGFFIGDSAVPNDDPAAGIIIEECLELARKFMVAVAQDAFTRRRTGVSA
jgi:hypothetical protein